MATRGSEEALLGFDARAVGLTGMPALGPGGGRPDQFLLRTDVDDVLSADTMVWPSIFSPPATLELPRPGWIGMNDPFWDDLNALLGAVPKGLGEDRPYWLIAATWHTDLGFKEEERRRGTLGPYITTTTPQQREGSWRFLGFDIADPGISGLSNCGYDDTERDGLAAEWSPHLNRFHLFDDLQRALEFRNLTNARVREHAPFFVIGLWRIA